MANHSHDLSLQVRHRTRPNWERYLTLPTILGSTTPDLVGLPRLVRCPPHRIRLIIPLCKRGRKQNIVMHKKERDPSTFSTRYYFWKAKKINITGCDISSRGIFFLSFFLFFPFSVLFSFFSSANNCAQKIGFSLSLLAARGLSSRHSPAGRLKHPFRRCMRARARVLSSVKKKKKVCVSRIRPDRARALLLLFPPSFLHLWGGEGGKYRLEHICI